MEHQFKAGDMVKIVGLNRPCQVLSVRTEDRVFKGRTDLVGTKVALSEPHYSVQIDGSSSTRFVPESKMKLIPTHELENERLQADALPSGPAQGIAPRAVPQAVQDRNRLKALAEEKARLKEQLEIASLAAEVDEMKAQLAGKKPN